MSNPRVPGQTMGLWEVVENGELENPGLYCVMISAVVVEEKKMAPLFTQQPWLDL
jgi:hypothetical protein